MSVFYDLSKTPRNILNQAIVRAIVSENNGALFDPSDLSTLYQDAAGTIPVTAVEQPVGLVLDKSRGLTLGPELVSNGTFDSSTGWNIDSTGFNISGGTLNANATTNNITSQTGFSFSAGRVYKLTATLTQYTRGAPRVSIGGNVIDIPGNLGTFTAYVKATNAATNLYIYAGYNGSGGVWSISDISIKELYGYHATQSITASRPTLSARKNILLATETLATQSVTTLAANYTLSFTGTGSVTLSGAATGALTGTGTDRVSLTFTPTAGTLMLTVSGSVTKAQLELSAVAGPYQRVTTATDYDTDERYFPKYLRFDGVDDYLNLPYMGLYANGSASVVVAIARSKTGTIKYALTEGNSAGGKNYIPLRLSDTGISSRIVNDAGTTVILTPESAGAATSLSEVITFIDDSANLKLLKNSQTSNNSGYARSGTLTLNTLTIGAISQATATENMLANLYGLIITKSAITDHQRVACERYLGRKSGVQL